MASDQAGEPGIDEAAFDELILAADGSMVVVAASDGDEVDACLVGFHCQCSIEPLRYAIWLSKANRTYRLAQRSDSLSVHWLPAHAIDLAAAVGTVTLDTDARKMDRVPWRRDASGLVRIDGAIGGFGGRIEHRHDDGDHECFVVVPTVVWSGSDERPPVLRFAGVRHLDAGHSADPNDD
jgi:flavin reductase (DIM6/NTAB) family NADH-FMN oxidoreductase RutF